MAELDPELDPLESPTPEPQAPAPITAPQDVTSDDVAAMFANRNRFAAARLRRTHETGLDTAPDEAAKTLTIAQQTQTPYDVVDRNLNALRKRSVLENTPYADLVRETPALADWMAVPGHASLVNEPDELARMGLLSYLFAAPQRAFAQGMNQDRYATLRTHEVMGFPLSPAEKDELASTKYNASLGGSLGGEQSWFRNAVVSGSKFLQFMYGPVTYGMAGATAGAAVGAVGGPPGILAGAAAGFGAGFTTGLGKTAFFTAVGPAADTYGEMRDLNGQPLDPGAVRMAALATGVLQAGFMLGGEQIGEALHLIPGVKGALAQRAVAAALRNPSILGALTQFGKRAAIGSTAGGAFMMGVEAINIMGEELAKTLGTDAPIPYDPEAAAERVGHAGVEGMSSFVLPSILGAAPAFAGALHEAVTSTKTVERNPVAFQAFVKRAAEHTDLANVYLPTDTFTEYWQSEGVDPARMAAELTGDPQAYGRALATGEDLRVPTATYATRVAPTKHHTYFDNELRVRKPNGDLSMNGREAVQLEKDIAEQQKAAREQPAAPESPARLEVLKRLLAIGIPARRAADYAQLWERLGVVPERAGFDAEAARREYMPTFSAPERKAGQAPEPLPLTDEADVPRSTESTPTAETAEVKSGALNEVSSGDEARPGVPGDPAQQPGPVPSGLDEERGNADGDRVRGLPARSTARPRDIDEVFVRQPAETVVARLTPDVRAQLAEIIDELSTFQKTDRTYNDVPGKPTGNFAGGHIDAVQGIGGSKIYFDILDHAPVNAVKRKGETTPAREARGTRAQVEAAARALLEREDVATNLQEGVLRYAERRALGDVKGLHRPNVPSTAWRKREAILPETVDELGRSIDAAVDPRADFLRDATIDESDVGKDELLPEGAESFDFFEQKTPPDDTLDTGEAQPRLPEDVGAVRDQEQPTPELEAPFSLTSEVAKPKKGKQDTLFHETPLTNDDVQTWAGELQQRTGADVSVRLTMAGDLVLEGLSVQREAPPTPGTAVLRELTRFADDHNARILLSPSPRLVPFYQRFGFVENTGRRRDARVSATMYREPTIPAGADLSGTEYSQTVPSGEAFYSRLTRAVETSQQGRASGAQWKAAIKNAKIGQNKDEFALARVDDLEDGTHYTKQEVLDYLKANEARVETVIMAEANEAHDARVRERADEIHAQWVDREVEQLEQRDSYSYRPTRRVEFNEEEGHWEVSVNDEELGRTFHDEESANAAADMEEEQQRDQWERDYGDQLHHDALQRVDYEDALESARRELEADAPPLVQFADARYNLRGAVPGSYREVFLTVPELGRGQARARPSRLAGLYPEERAVLEAGGYGPDLEKMEALLRDDRRGEAIVYMGQLQLRMGGPRDFLPGADVEKLLRERDLMRQVGRIMQLDTTLDVPSWRDGHEAYDDIVNPIVRLRFDERRADDGSRILFLEEVQPPLNRKDNNQFAQMPRLFQQQWREIAFKWALRYAAEQGFDTVAWTTGKHQADRWDLAKQVDEIRYRRNDDGTYAMTVWKNGRSIDQAERFSATRDALEAFVGHAIVARMDASEGPIHESAVGKELRERGEAVEVLPVRWERAANLVDGKFLPLTDAEREAHGGILLDWGIRYADGSIMGVWGGEESARLDMARQNRELREAPYRVLKGDNLEVGGAGLKRLYDVDFERVVHALPAVKKHGGRVETQSIATGEMAPTGRYQYEGPTYTPEELRDRAYALQHDAPRTSRDLFSVANLVEGGNDFGAAVVSRQNLRLGMALGGTIAITKTEPPRMTVPTLPITPAMRDGLLAGQALFQEGDPPANPTIRRGSIRFGHGADRSISITLLRAANPSTVLHEFGHLFYRMFGDVADALGTADPESLNDSQRRVLADYTGLRDALGATPGAELTEAQQETMARMFEAYLREGRAPSLELRGAFSRFRAWLLKVYKSLRALNVELTPETRGIFDRMLASDEEIAAAEAQRGPQPLFTTAERFGLGADEFALYKTHIEAAAMSAREELDRQLLASVGRESTRTWKEQEADTRATVEAEAHAQPVYQALAAILRGEQADGHPLEEGRPTAPLRLSRALVVDRYGKARVGRLPGGSTIEVGGLDPDLVAERFGFTSGDALLTAMEQAEPMDALVARQTRERMVAEHGAALLDGTLEERAKMAVANADRDRVIRTEIRALNALRRTVEPFVRLEHKKARQGAASVSAGIPPAAVMRGIARERVKAMAVGDVDSGPFWSASRRARQQGIDRLGRQDYSGAITALTQELINLAIYREVERTKEEIDARVEAAQAHAGKAGQKLLRQAGPGYRDQMNQLLDRFGFAPAPKTERQIAGLADWIKGIESQGVPIELPTEVLNEAFRKPYAELTVDEFMAVTDGIKAIQRASQYTKRLLRADEKRDLDTLATDLGAGIRRQFTGTPAVVSRDRSSGETTRSVGEFMASHIRLSDFAREMDGFVDGGPMWDMLVRPLNEAGAREAERKAASTKVVADLLETAYPLSQKRHLFVKLEIPAIGKSLSKLERIVIGLNSGNQGNIDVLRAGEKWGPDEQRAVLDTLDARDLTLIQGIWDHYNSFWDEIAAKQERVFGFAPERVEPVPLVARAGTIPGGYQPLKYDDRLSARASQNIDLEAGNLAKLAAYGAATTARGHTIERIKGVSLPIQFGFGPVFQHLNQVIHDLTHHEALIDIGRVLAHSEVQSAIFETYGDVTYKKIKSAIRDIAYGEQATQSGLEGALSFFRSGSAIAGLGWRVSSGLLQLADFGKAMQRIGPRWFVQGMVHWGRDLVSQEHGTQWIRDNSVTMANRWRTYHRDLYEIQRNLGVHTGRFSGWVEEALHAVSLGTVDKQKLVDSYFYFVGKGQQIMDIVTFLGQYEKSRAAGEPHERAVAIADTAVIDIYGGGQLKDLPSVMRGGELLKTWTLFYGPYNASLALLRESVKRTRWTEPASVARLGADFVLNTITPMLLGLGIHAALRSGTPQSNGDDQDARSWAAYLAREGASYLADHMVGTRELSSAIEGFYNYEGPAATRGLADIVHLMAATGRLVTKYEEDRTEEALTEYFWRALEETGGVLFHTPLPQLGRTIRGLYAISDGRAGPIAAVSGPPPKRQQ